MEHLYKRLEFLYENKASWVYEKILRLVETWKEKSFEAYDFVNHKDVCLICYGDSIKQKGVKPLEVLNQFANDYLTGIVNIIHILPMFPYTSDDGFSVVDFKSINSEFGDWTDIKNLKQNYNLMFDAVINHCSVSSAYFKGYIAGDEKYKDFFIEYDEKFDYSHVTRPRTTPLFTEFETPTGIKKIWTTFSDDQVDLNFANPNVLLEVLDILLTYAHNGARFIRLDAIGFAWKESGTTCMHLAQTHELIKVFRTVLSACAEGITLITETNVPHKDNISYFGNGYDEANLVYQFPLPPLVLHSILTENASKLTQWAATLEKPSGKTTFFNFLASHDGIGIRPVEGILTDEEVQFLAKKVIEREGKINYRSLSNGDNIPYELNITYMSALSDISDTDENKCKRLLVAYAIIMALSGLPAIYIHSLLGTENDIDIVKESGINRRINRKKIEYSEVKKELNKDSLMSKTFSGMKKLILARKQNPLFDIDVTEQVLNLGNGVFAIKRSKNDKEMICITSVLSVSTEITIPGTYTDIFSGEKLSGKQKVKPYQILWGI